MNINIKKIKFKKTDFAFTVLFTIGILIVLNFFSYQIFHRWDLTKNNIYSISKATKNTIKNLNDIITIKVYFSNNLPSQYLNLKQEVKDVLEEYQNNSGNKIKVEYISPESDENTALGLARKGIPELQFNVYEKDKLQVVKGYLGLLIKQGDKEEVIPYVKESMNLEYELTLAIKKVSSNNLASIGVLSGHGTLSSNDKTGSGITLAYRELTRLYSIETVDLIKDKKISDKINTLLILGPKDKFTDAELKALDEFIAKGGSVLVLLDGVKVDSNLKANDNKTDLDVLFEKYGIKINNNLVLDTSSGLANFNQGIFTFAVNYPFFPKIINSGFDKNNASVSKLESLVLPFASSIDIDNSKIDKQSKIYYLAETTDKSWTVNGSYDLNPESIKSTKNTGKKIVAISFFGPIKSAYSDKKSNYSKLIVVANSGFLEDKIANNNADNLIFFQNLVDTLALDEGLVNIRSKSITEYLLKDNLLENEKLLIKYINIFGLTLVVIIFGLSRYLLRRRKII